AAPRWPRSRPLRTTSPSWPEPDWPACARPWCPPGEHRLAVVRRALLVPGRLVRAVADGGGAGRRAGLGAPGAAGLGEGLARRRSRRLVRLSHVLHLVR